MAHNCEQCKAEIPEKVHNYSKKNYGKVLCRDCQKDSDSKPNNKKDSNKKEEPVGLSKREGYYKEGMIKGRIAETLIEELFLSLKYNVFRYGMENTVPGIMELLKGVRSDVADNIRRMPDFVIQKKEGGQVYFLEVKFRKNEEFSIKDLPKNYPFENAYFVVVSKKHIKCITYEELKAGKEISPTSKNYLGSRKEFELDKGAIIDFCNFAIKFFRDV
ncbi:MAG: hypothetical protein KJ600_03305 [Nanoarchaeota archaeon]|nr:hypothetical protein [Nanoarchaeota archaeon]MBU1103555.1 hypothetical protein [Nanoarchaeota archaeon]MBU1989058.1 hypothetical protein [Nanoarchaeota archaeon]